MFDRQSKQTRVNIHHPPPIVYFRLFLFPAPIPMSAAATRHVNPPTWERLSVILAFPLIGLALGIPWWIGTTSIERRSLGAVQRLCAVDAVAGRVQVRVEGPGSGKWSWWVSECVKDEDRGWELDGNASTGESGLM